MVVARPGGFSDIVVADLEETGEYESVFRISPVLFGRACRIWDDWLEQRKIDGERRIFQDKWTVFLHSTEKEFLCV